MSFNKKTGNAVAVLAFTVLITASALSAKNISTEKKESKTAKSVTESVADTENVSDTELANSAKKIPDTQKADTEASEQNNSNSNSTDNAGTSTDISGDVGKSGSRDAYETDILKNDESETDEDDGTSGKDGQVTIREMAIQKMAIQTIIRRMTTNREMIRSRIAVTTKIMGR